MSDKNWKGHLKCAAGFIGGGILGGFTGAGAGSAIPVIGTLACGVIGVIAGAGAGAAGTC